MIKLVKVPHERKDIRHSLAQLLVEQVRSINDPAGNIRRIGRTLKLNRINDAVIDVLSIPEDRWNEVHGYTSR